MKLDRETLTGPELRELRMARKQSQTEFWGALGVAQPSGHAYEQGRKMPKPVRILAFLHHVVGIPTEADYAVLAPLAQAMTALRSSAGAKP